MNTNWYEQPRFVIPLLALAVIILLSGCVNAPFNAVDDGLTLYQMLSHSTAELFTPKAGKHFMPITDLSLRLDYFFIPQETAQHMNAALEGKELFDVNWPGAAHFRVMGALYHFVAAIFLWIFLRRISKGYALGGGVALFVALAWAMHPMMCESVCWIAERKSTLAAMFGFAALAAWTIEPGKLWRWPLIYALYLLALLSKPAALSLLPLLLALEVLDPIRHQFDVRNTKHWLASALRCAPLVALGFAFFFIGKNVYSLEIVDPIGGGGFSVVLTDIWILAVYIRHMLLPAYYSFTCYVEPVVSLGDPRFWVGLLTLSGVFSALIFMTERAQRPLVILGLYWFISGLGPNLNIVPTMAPLQDRWTYLGMAGFLFAATVAVHSQLQRRESTRKVLLNVSCCVMFVLAIFSHLQSRMYESNESLFFQTAKQEPKSGYAQLISGDLARDLHIKALQQFETRKTLSREEAERKLKEADVWGKMAVDYYEHATVAPDIEYFKDGLELRTRTAEMLTGMKQYDRARKQLEGWLPPPGKTLFTAADSKHKGIVRARRELRHTYTALTLSHAWDLMAQCSLQQANNRTLPLPAQMELAKRALGEIDKAIEADINGERGEVIKARILMLMAYIESDSGHDEPAQKLFGDAQAQLRTIPDSSPSAAMAKQILDNAKPPKPKSPPPLPGSGPLLPGSGPLLPPKN